jgi:hypothetical protein
MVIRLLAGEKIDCSLRAARTMGHACLDGTHFEARKRAGQRENVQVLPYSLSLQVILNFAYNNYPVCRLQMVFGQGLPDGAADEGLLDGTFVRIRMGLNPDLAAFVVPAWIPVSPGWLSV